MSPAALAVSYDHALILCQALNPLNPGLLFYPTHTRAGWFAMMEPRRGAAALPRRA